MAKRWLLPHGLGTEGGPRPDQLATDAMLRSFVDRKRIADTHLRLPALFRMWINENGRQPTNHESAVLTRYFERRAGVRYEGDGDKRDLLLGLGCVMVLHLVPSLLLALRGIAPEVPPELSAGVLLGGVYLFNLTPLWLIVPLAVCALATWRLGFLGGLILGIVLTLVIWLVVAFFIFFMTVQPGSAYGTGDSSRPIGPLNGPGMGGPIGPLQSPSGARSPSGASSGARR